MALFVLECADRPAGLALRLATRETHLAWLATSAPTVKAAGALLDGDGAPCGSLLIVEAADADAVRAWAAADPYAVAGLFASVTVRPWRLAIGRVGGGD